MSTDDKIARPTTPIRIIHLEDDPLDAELIRTTLKEEGVNCNICHVKSRDEFVSAIESGGCDIILSDHSLPGFDGISALALAKEKLPDVPFLFVSGKMGEELAIETLKTGATDYVLKNRISRLAPSLHRAIAEAAERSERRKMVEELESSHEQLRQLAQHLQTIREEERHSISREIHDELGQMLTALKMDLDFVRKALPEEQKALCEKVDADMGIVNEIIYSVKRICDQLRPSILDYLGVEAAIEWHAAEFQKTTGILCSVESSLDDDTIDKDRSTALFRIFQESLTNVARHSGATAVTASLQKLNGSIVLEISDNGKGMNPRKHSKPKSFGLIGMRERAYQLGGDVEISGAEGKGTTIKAIVPAK